MVHPRHKIQPYVLVPVLAHLKYQWYAVRPNSVMLKMFFSCTITFAILQVLHQFIVQKSVRLTVED